MWRVLSVNRCWHFCSRIRRFLQSRHPQLSVISHDLHRLIIYNLCWSTRSSLLNIPEARRRIPNTVVLSIPGLSLITMPIDPMNSQRRTLPFPRGRPIIHHDRLICMCFCAVQGVEYGWPSAVTSETRSHERETCRKLAPRRHCPEHATGNGKQVPGYNTEHLQRYTDRRRPGAVLYKDMRFGRHSFGKCSFIKFQAEILRREFTGL